MQNGWKRLGVVAIVIAVAAQRSEALDCVTPPVETGLQQSTAVFAGRAITVNPTNGTVIIEISAIWKGAKQGTVSVSFDSKWGPNFRTGADYLVYCTGDKELFAGSCSRTKLLANAEEDLVFLTGDVATAKKMKSNAVSPSPAPNGSTAAANPPGKWQADGKRHDSYEIPQVMPVAATPPPSNPALKGLTIDLQGNGSVVTAVHSSGRMIWQVKLPTPATAVQVQGNRVIVQPFGWVIDLATGKIMEQRPVATVSRRETIAPPPLSGATPPHITLMRQPLAARGVVTNGMSVEIVSVTGDAQAEWTSRNNPPLGAVPPKMNLRFTWLGAGKVGLFNYLQDRTSTPDALLPEVVDAEGEPVTPVTWVLPVAAQGFSYLTLTKGESHEVSLTDGFLPMLENSPKAPMVFGNRRYELKPGRYKLRLTLQGGGTDKLGDIPVWHDKVTTDWFEFTVKEGPIREMTDAELDVLAQRIAEQQLPATGEKAFSLLIPRRYWNDKWKIGGSNDQPLSSPFLQHRFYYLLLGHTKAAPLNMYLALSRTGEPIARFDPTKHFAAILKDEDRSGWTVEDYRNAGILYVHLMSGANQDAGWRILQPADFEKFAADPKGGTIKEYSAAALKHIRVSGQPPPPPVAVREGVTTVHFFSWHSIGGALKEWTFTFGPEFRVDCKELGLFGGGGYD